MYQTIDMDTEGYVWYFIHSGVYIVNFEKVNAGWNVDLLFC